jgi:Brp/Blh family beta-carotene 15,15'-monooxygenase
VSLRFQGLAFSAVAWLSLAVCLGLPHLDLQAQLLLLSPVILLLGVPHGALDIVFVRQLTHIQSPAAWALFTLGYLMTAASVVAVWYLAPGWFLASFLLVSAFHFSADPEGQTPVSFRLLYGGAVIFCPLIWHAAEVTQIFALLVGESAAQAVVMALQWAAGPWLAGIGLASIAGAKKDLARSIEMVSAAALLSVAPPLIGFTIFFCCMHSARHVLRTCDYAAAGTVRQLLQAAVWPMLATVAGIAVLVCLSQGKPLDSRVAQILFVALAALTVPHMIVVERVRCSGWLMGRRHSRSTNQQGGLYE